MSFWFYLNVVYPFKGWLLRKFFAQEIEWIREDAKKEVWYGQQ